MFFVQVLRDQDGGRGGVGQSITFDHAGDPGGRSKYHIRSRGGGGGSKKG